MTTEKDPWADLAESLGAPASSEPQPPRAAEPPRPRPTPQPPRPRPRATASNDWDSLASDLGIEGGRAAASEPPPAIRPQAPQRRPSEDRPARECPPAERRVEQRRDEPPARDGWADEVIAERSERVERPSGDRDDSGEARDSGEGRERRGRRRRGRRGGRGRRDGARDESRSAANRDDRRDRPSESGVIATEFDRPREPRAADLQDDDRPAGFEDESTPRSEGESDGDQPARRRRRGRRGGRRRGRSTRERLAGERTAAEQPESEQRLDEMDDEPLATGYGAPPRQGASGRTESGRSEKERVPASGEGERRGRRRRRGSGDSRSTTARREPERESGRRRSGDASRSTSRSERSRRRDDFTPVAGRFDEDDEGLEFLGVEEAGRAGTGPRERRPGSEDDAIAESGLDTVREVPSWVEAIGIVIAANLDARNKSSSGRK